MISPRTAEKINMWQVLLFSIFLLTPQSQFWAQDTTTSVALEDNEPEEVETPYISPTSNPAGTINPYSNSASATNTLYSSATLGGYNAAYQNSQFGFFGQRPPELPEGFDPSWYLRNPEVPEALKGVLADNELALHEYAVRARTSCVRLQENGLLDFFNKEVMSFVRSKPSICQAFEAKEETIRQQFWGNGGFGNGWGASQGLNELNNYNNQQSTIEVKYTSYNFNSELLEDQDELPPFEKLLLAGLEKESPYSGFSQSPLQSGIMIPHPYADQPGLQNQPQENFQGIIDGPRESMKKPHPLLVQTMLMRIWDKLSPLHQMQGVRECPGRLKLNDSSLTWQLNDEPQSESDQFFELFKEICEAQEMEELLPFMDESIMTELALHSGELQDPTSMILPMCINWPEAQVVTPRPLPPVTVDQIIYRGSELSRLTNHMYRQAQALNLFNRRNTGSPLTPEQIQALSDYTANGSYDRINAYEMWGRLGVWYMSDDQPNQGYTEEAFNQFNPRPERSSFTSQAEYEAAFAHYLEKRAQWLPLIYGTPEQQAEVRAAMEQNQTVNDPMKTHSGIPLSETSQHLKEALDSLDGFEGITFGGHQLSGHLMKGVSIREGATFSPGFFMSTSTTPQTALNFLGIFRAQGFGDQRAMQRIQNGEEVNMNENVTGYLFVVRNRNGVPIANYSNYSSENEVLLHPDAEYRILKVEPLEHNGQTYPNAQVVYVDEISR